MSKKLNFAVVSFTLRMSAGLCQVLILAFGSTIPNHLKLWNGRETQETGLSVNCIMVMSSFLFLKSDVVPDLNLGPHLGPKPRRSIWLIVSSFSVESIEGRLGPWWIG